MHGFIVDTRKGTSQKTGDPYHVVEICTQDEAGRIGVLSYFLKPHEQGDEDWRRATIGTIVEIETEERQQGMNTYVNVASAQVIPNAKVTLQF